MSSLDKRSFSSSGRVDVLVIDDEPIVVKRLSTLLTGLGYSVTACTDSEDALDIIGRRNFTLIITDLKMRKVDGLRILQEARLRDKDIKVIIMTGFGNGENLDRVRRKEMIGLIYKPFKMKELQDVIAASFSNHS